MKKIFKMVLSKNQYKNTLIKEIKSLLINCVSTNNSLLKDELYTTINLSLPNTHLLIDKNNDTVIYVSKYDIAKNKDTVGNEIIMVTYNENIDKLYIFNYFNKFSYCKLDTLPIRHLEVVYKEIQNACKISMNPTRGNYE